jgi:hypothetical protein
MLWEGAVRADAAPGPAQLEVASAPSRRPAHTVDLEGRNEARLFIIAELCKQPTTLR